MKAQNKINNSNFLWSHSLRGQLCYIQSSPFSPGISLSEVILDLKEYQKQQWRQSLKEGTVRGRCLSSHPTGMQAWYQTFAKYYQW